MADEADHLSSHPGKTSQTKDNGMNRFDNLRGKVVAITGASAGLGRSIARAYGRRGAKVGLIARGRDGLEGALREVKQMGGTGLVIPADVADAGQIEEAARGIEENLGPIDIWINNAMTSVFSPVKEMKPEEYRRVTEVTYLGSVYGTLAALKWMLPRNSGVIVLVGSALAYRGIPLQSAYCGAKHAIQGFFDSLRCELLRDSSNVHLTMIQLPAMNTTQFGWVRSRLPRKAQPVPPIFQPEAAAEAVVWASQHRRREIYFGRSSVKAIVANKFFPGLLDHYLAKTGFDSQQFDGLEDPDRPDNLWAPIPGDHGAHGSFDDRSLDFSPQFELSKNRAWLLAAGLVAGAMLCFNRLRNRSRMI
jgi:short-subunit dehydrogenase